VQEPHLEVLLLQAKALEAQFREIKFVHVVRVFNAAADYVAGKTLRAERDYQVVEDEEITKLKILNKLQREDGQLHASTCRSHLFHVPE